MISILASLVPICPDCSRVMVRSDWNSPRPRAICTVCEKAHYYGSDGRIMMSAKLRKAA